MILRRYGTTLRSVDLDFNSKALNEIGFRRDREASIPVEEFEEAYESVLGHSLTAESEGDVQGEVEQRMLDDLAAQLDRVMEEMSDGEVLVIQSEQGNDYPKTRSRSKNVIVEGENRLYFYSSIDPPLRVGVYRKR